MPANPRRLVLKTALLTLLAAALLATGAGLLVFRAGWYDIGASTPHLQAVYSFLEQGMRYSVQHHARAVAEPALDQPDQARRGANLYSQHCAQCHGGPGFAPAAHGMSMQPVPGPLVDAPRRWKPRELYWITRHGIKMSGMPAWETRLDEADTWALVAFLQRLPGLDAQAYAGMTAPLPDEAAQAARRVAQEAAPPPPPVVRGDAARGKRVLALYACQSCHRVPGITGSETWVGRPLEGLAKRRTIAGRLENTEDNLVRWIRDPRAVDPDTAMPAMGVSERDARDISAYLLSR